MVTQGVIEKCNLAINKKKKAKFQTSLFLFLFVVQKKKIKKKYKKNLRAQREKNGIETSETYFLGLQQFFK